MNFKTLTLREALAEDLLNSLATDLEETLEDSLDTLVVRIYEGDTILNESIDLYDLYYAQNIAGIIVNGNLSVNGTIIDFEIDTYSCFLIVHGSLTCKTLAAGVAEILVNGDLHATDAVVTYYNHGVIEISGNLHANLFIVDDHGINIFGETHAATYCRGWHLQGADYTNWKDILLPDVATELLDEGGYLFAGDVRLLKMLQEDKPVFKQTLGNFSPENNPTPREASWAEVKPLVQGLPCKYEEYPFGIAEKQTGGLPDDKFLIYDGTTVLDSLDLDTEEYTGIIVVGNLIVKGNIINENTDGACSLIVLGNLKAKNMCVGGQTIYINGYIDVEEVLIGIYNHGELYGKSYVWCPAIINDDYHFYFEDFASVKVLDLWEDADKDLVKELLIDDIFDEEDNFLPYSTLREADSLLKPVTKRTEITVDDLTRLMNIPLFGPDNLEISFSENGWHISIDRGGYEDEDGDTAPSSLSAIHIEKGENFFWYLSTDNTITTLVKDGSDEWITATGKWMPKVFEHFTLIETLINRKVHWNNKYVKEINKEELWELIWMFRNHQTQEVDVFHAMASAVFTRVLYGAAYPFAYVFARYKEESEHRGLENNPEWIHAAALLDGLIYLGLATEVTRTAPLAEKKEDLAVVTELNWDYIPEIPERYASQPIDRDFLCEVNKELLSVNGALLRLDPGVGSFILGGMNLDDVEILNSRMQPWGINPKYFTYADPEEEAALKQTAHTLIQAAADNNKALLNSLREQQPGLWDYVYNERGDVVFWQDWIEKLQRRLTDNAGMAYMYRGEAFADPMDPELEYWIDWCERWEKVKENSHIILPE